MKISNFAHFDLPTLQYGEVKGKNAFRVKAASIQINQMEGSSKSFLLAQLQLRSISLLKRPKNNIKCWFYRLTMGTWTRGWRRSRSSPEVRSATKYLRPQWKLLQANCCCVNVVVVAVVVVTAVAVVVAAAVVTVVVVTIPYSLLSLGKLSALASGVRDQRREYKAKFLDLDVEIQRIKDRMEMMNQMLDDLHVSTVTLQGGPKEAPHSRISRPFFLDCPKPANHHLDGFVKVELIQFKSKARRFFWATLFMYRVDRRYQWWEHQALEKGYLRDPAHPSHQMVHSPQESPYGKGV